MGSKKKAEMDFINAKKVAPKSKRLPLINFKISSKDRKVIMANADKHAGGNYSAWLRHAGLNYRPKKGEVIR